MRSKLINEASERTHVLVFETGDDVLIVADGFSCREQIAHCTGRTAWHPAQVLALALHAGAEAR